MWLCAGGARRRAQAPATFTTTDASAPTLGDASAAQCAITAPSARISSTIVWTEVIRLLEDPSLIQSELDRRLIAARTADPAKQREKALQRELTRTRKSMDRLLLTAYQEDLLSLDELRRRMPELRQREHAWQTELHSILDQINDRAVYLRLAETLSGFLTRLRASADTLDILERQRIVRLVIKEILVGDETIVIRHSIPLSSVTPSGDGGVRSAAIPGAGDRSYLLRSGSNHAALRRAAGSFDLRAVLHAHRRGQPSLDVQDRPWARHMFPNRP